MCASAGSVARRLLALWGVRINTLVLLGLALVLWSVTALPAQPPPAAAVIFENVRIFNSTSTLSAPSHVLVVGNVIREISSAPIADPTGGAALRIRGEGRTLMPGLIDNHWHTMLARPTPAQSLSADVGYLNFLAGAEAEATLMRGFTSVRDLGGPSFGLKQAIDNGLVAGPRIYPAGAIITVTGGHGDFRSPTEVPRQLGGPLPHMSLLNASMVADSPDEVRVRVREQLLLGAVHIKLTAGGGVASPHSPLDVSTFTEEELRAAVEAASNWNTYVGVHAYTPIAITRAIAAGVKVIEHGHLMDEASGRLMAEKGVWLSFQPFTDDGIVPQLPPANMRRLKEVWSGTETTMALARKYTLKVAFGTDILFSAQQAAKQGMELVKMTRWYTPSEVLTLGTAINAELLKLSGPRDPYPGKLGVIAEGALADLLLVDGDPIANIRLLENPAASLVVIMKDGKIFKNTSKNKDRQSWH